MKCFVRPEAVVFSYPIRQLGDPDSFLFFDIETTGLSPADAQVYMIGALTHAPDTGWTLRQWFADSLSGEADMLREFFSFASGFRVLVHYNGDGFDIPFLLRCASQYRIPDPFGGMQSLDLYRAVRPFRKILGTERLNQKSMEQLLGLDRRDPFTGGELISVYQSFLSSQRTALLQQLLLHNEEDVTSLPLLLSLLSFRDFFEGSFTLMPDPESASESASASDPVSGNPADPNVLSLLLTGEVSLPAPVFLETELFQMRGEGKLLRMDFPVFSGELYYYFENYRDYYYLPLEDRAIHKSVGVFVDKAVREQATARTARVSQSGCFVRWPGNAPADRKLFVPEYRSRERYTLLPGASGQPEEPNPERDDFLLRLCLDSLCFVGLRS